MTKELSFFQGRVSNLNAQTRKWEYGTPEALNKFLNLAIPGSPSVKNGDNTFVHCNKKTIMRMPAASCHGTGVLLPGPRKEKRFLTNAVAYNACNECHCVIQVCNVFRR